MRFDAISAKPHPAGNRVELGWRFPAAPDFTGVRVVRREGSHPIGPDDGVTVAQGIGTEAVVDGGLKGETVYYYSLFGYRGDPPEYDIDRANRIDVLVSAPHDQAGQMQALLPAVYARYDLRFPEVVPPAMTDSDKQRGQLRRFLDLPGAQLDLLQSYAKAALDLCDVNRTPGRLLPLLADWIAWKTDYQLEVETQRNEISQAPFVYQTVGLKPTIEATVKRISGWESRTKEFVHNVVRSNQPERLNLWLKTSDGTDWSAPAQLLSLDYAYDARPAAVRDAGGTSWLFTHTLGNGFWRVRYKRTGAGGEWLPSEPLAQAANATNKYPTATLAGGTPWVFWLERDESTGLWRIVNSIWDGARWSEPEPLPFAANDPRQPAALSDGAGNVWLFWLERTATGRELRYNRHDGAAWGAPIAFPLDGGVDPRVEAELSVLFDPATTRIWLVWSRDTTLAGDQTRREIAYRIKGDANFDAANWTAVQTFPKPGGGDYHDREPAARLDAGGRTELYWSANRDPQGYGIWRSVLTNEGANTWSAPERLTEGPYSQRAPLPIALNGEIGLIFGANQSITYPSAVYAATVSTDFRYAGATAVDTRNTAKIGLRGAFEDFAAYTYDTGPLGNRGNDDWYARDTVGLYLAADTLDADRVDSAVDRIRGVLGGFMPMTDRAVFITASDRHDEYAYTYEAPGADEPRFISESFNDALTAVAEDTVLEAGEDFTDALE